MNIEKEKKKYVAPFMEILEMNAKSSLLSASGRDNEDDDDDGVDLENGPDDYFDEFN